MAREVSSISQIKANILRPALTSQYIVQVPFPPGLAGVYVQNIVSADQEKLNLLCCETSLPGSSFLTSEALDDHTGVTERHAYRRNYGQQIDFTFYVDAEKYLPITFFESWMALIAGEDVSGGSIKQRNFSHRFRYPHDYKAQQGLKIKKFERDYYTQEKKPNILEDIVNIVAGTDFGSIETKKSGPDIEYEFLDAFPVAINSMPISYDTSQLLKCTVSFSYTRYVINRVNVNNIGKSSSGTSGPTQSAAANNFFKENRDSIINDPNPTKFIDPQTFIQKYGDGQVIQDPNQGFA
jgi:hypothetical protein